MTDDEFFDYIDSICGKDWSIEDIRENAALYAEFIKRTGRGIS